MSTYNRKGTEMNHNSSPMPPQADPGLSPEAGIRVDGFDQVLAMLKIADAEFRDSLLRRLAARDKELATSLLRELRASGIR